MKIQDLSFILALAVFVSIRKPRLSVMAGLFCLLLSIPLFALHVFFTAERLTWYAAALFLLSTIQLIIKKTV